MNLCTAQFLAEVDRRGYLDGGLEFDCLDGFRGWQLLAPDPGGRDCESTAGIFLTIDGTWLTMLFGATPTQIENAAALFENGQLHGARRPLRELRQELQRVDGPALTVRMHCGSQLLPLYGVDAESLRDAASFAAHYLAGLVEHLPHLYGPEYSCPPSVSSP